MYGKNLTPELTRGHRMGQHDALSMLIGWSQVKSFSLQRVSRRFSRVWIYRVSTTRMSQRGREGRTNLEGIVQVSPIRSVMNRFGQGNGVNAGTADGKRLLFFWASDTVFVLSSITLFCYWNGLLDRSERVHIQRIHPGWKQEAQESRPPSSRCTSRWPCARIDDAPASTGTNEATRRSMAG